MSQKLERWKTKGHVERHSHVQPLNVLTRGHDLANDVMSH